MADPTVIPDPLESMMQHWKGLTPATKGLLAMYRSILADKYGALQEAATEARQELQNAFRHHGPGNIADTADGLPRTILEAFQVGEEQARLALCAMDAALVQALQVAQLAGVGVKTETL